MGTGKSIFFAAMLIGTFGAAPAIAQDAAAASRTPVPVSPRGPVIRGAPGPIAAAGAPFLLAAAGAALAAKRWRKKR